MKQSNIWIDFLHKNGETQIGIECDDESLTYDGRFIMIVPKRDDEADLSKAMERAETIMEYMRGQKQMKRDQ